MRAVFFRLRPNRNAWQAIAGLFAIVCLSLYPTARTSAQFDEQQVKAAFLVNFLKFVTWPDASQHGPLVVGVIGADDFARVVEREIAGQAVGGRSVSVRIVHTVRDLQPTPQLLYIDASERHNLSAMLREVAGQPVLTVGDGEGFGAAGVALNFYVSDKRIRFEANTTAATRAGLRISAHLLRIARIVG